MRLLGLDPGLRYTGWGVIEANGNALRHVANGRVATDDGLSLAERLAQLYGSLRLLIEAHGPDEAAVEETFVNRNPASALKLGQARGVVLLAPAVAGIPVTEYPANQIKKAIVGAGHAAKDQMAHMVGVLLPGCKMTSADAADALAVAICHAHYGATLRRWNPRPLRAARPAGSVAP